MEQLTSFDKQSITDGFLVEKYDSSTWSIVKNLDYSLQIQINRGMPFGFNSITSITIARKRLVFDSDTLKATWMNLGKQYEISSDKFDSVRFGYPKQDVGKSLSLLVILGLKSVYDNLKKSETNGLLFRSDIFGLRQLGIWNNTIELDSLASDILRSSKALSSHERRYKKMPLIYDFLLDGNEIYNLICWAGSNKKNRQTNCYHEKVWFLKIDVSNVSIVDGKGDRYTDADLYDILEYFFPKKSVLLPHELHSYKKMLQMKKTLFFSTVASEEEEPAESSMAENLARIVNLNFLDNHKKFVLNDKVCFNSIFQICSKKFIVDRDTMLARLSHLISKSNMPFIFLLGNMGVGKSIGIVQYILRSKNEPIHFFINHERNLADPSRIIKHLIVSLFEKYRFEFIELPNDFDSLIDTLNIVLSQVSKKLYDIYHRKEVIILDGLEQSLYMSQFREETTQLLSAIQVPKNIKIIIVSRFSNVFKEYIDNEFSNALVIGKEDLDLKSDLKEYCVKRLDSDLNVDRWTLSKFDGNFRYTFHTIDKMFEKNVSLQSLRDEDHTELNRGYENELLQLTNFVPDRRSIEFLVLTSIYTRLHRQENHIDHGFVQSVLDIRDEELETILEPIVQFFDITPFLKDNHKLLYHSSFGLYLNQNKTIFDFQRSAIEKLLVFVTRSIEEYRLEEVPEEVFGFLPLQAVKSYTEEELLSYFKETLIPLFFRNEKLVFGQIHPLFIFYCTHFAATKELPDQIIFYNLLNCAKVYYYGGREFFIEGLKKHDPELKKVKDLIKRIGATKSGKSIYQKTIDAYLDNKISGFDIESLLGYGFLFVSKKFENYDDILRLCTKYSESWTEHYNS